MKELSAGAIIFRKEKNKIKYLILLYGLGHWDFVKGHVEKNESEKETIIREAEEEAGLKDLKFIPGFKEKISYVFRKEGKLVSKSVIFLLAETKTAKIKLSFEHEAYKWLEFEEAVKNITYKNSKNVIKKADKFLKKHFKQKTLSF